MFDNAYPFPIAPDVPCDVLEGICLLTDLCIMYVVGLARCSSSVRAFLRRHQLRVDAFRGSGHPRCCAITIASNICMPVLPCPLFATQSSLTYTSANLKM